MQKLLDRIVSIFMVLLFLFFSSVALSLILGIIWMVGGLYHWYFEFHWITRTIASLIFVSIVFKIIYKRSIFEYLKELWEIGNPKT